MPTTGRLDWINISNQIRYGDIRRGQLLYVAVLGRQPGNRRGVSFFRQEFATVPADRSIRIIVDLAPRDVWHLRIKQRGQGAQDAAFRLSAQPEEKKIVPREDRVHD